MNGEENTAEKRKQILQSVVKHVKPLIDLEQSQKSSQKYCESEIRDLYNTVNFYLLKNKIQKLQMSQVINFL